MNERSWDAIWVTVPKLAWKDWERPCKRSVGLTTAPTRRAVTNLTSIFSTIVVRISFDWYAQECVFVPRWRALMDTLYHCLVEPDWTVQVSKPGRRKRFFTFPKRRHPIWGPINLLFKEYRGSFPEVKQQQRDVNHLPPSVAEILNG